MAYNWDCNDSNTKGTINKAETAVSFTLTEYTSFLLGSEPLIGQPFYFVNY